MGCAPIQLKIKTIRIWYRCFVLIELQLSPVKRRRFEFTWDKRAGPILFVNFGQKRLELALFCHRNPERSFSLLGCTMPICARCSGLLLGFLGFALSVFLQLHFPLVAEALMMVPMAVDGVSQMVGFRESNNRLRLFTGFMFTFGFMMLAVKR